MSQYVKTDTILDKILAQKVRELEAATLPLATIRAHAESMPKAPSFSAALRRDTIALIAEVKKASPSKGVLIENFEPMSLARTYAENGAAALSVLTDEQFFQGHLDYLREISQGVSLPTLRKDFIIAAYQVYEARAVGAAAVLLIVAALEDAQMADLHALILELGMSPLVEVHNEAELDRALAINAKLIGINNRDLKTFHVDTSITGRIAQRVPSDVTLVAESGLKTAADIVLMGQLGAHAVLIGEGLVIADNIALKVREFSSQRAK